MKNNLTVIRAFENLLHEAFPAFSKAFCRELALRLANFAYIWDEFSETDALLVEQAQESVVQWVRQSLKQKE